MFLTKKGLLKIIILVAAYFVIGTACISFGYLFKILQVDVGLSFVLGAIFYALCPVLFFFGRYAEGKGNYINLGNKLVRKELRPAEFIDKYNKLKNSQDLVINKPSFEVLHLVVVAYNVLNDSENCLATLDEMLAVASDKNIVMAKLSKASVLFSYGNIDEAEELFIEAQKSKPNAMCNMLIDSILKGDRAVAMGDYKTAELHYLKMLEQKFPKLDNLGRLVVHFSLGEIYEKMEDKEKAVYYYQYCADFGGETPIKTSARAALERLQ